MTDVTGFGLLGHGLEMARGAGVTVEIAYRSIPFLAEAEALAQAGFVTGASRRNWESYGDDVILPSAMPEWRRRLAHRPANLGRPARRVRGAAIGGGAWHHRGVGLLARAHHRFRR